jgi:hypothetical protein
MKTEFLAVYDYGAGGAWAYLSYDHGGRML